MEQDSKSLRVPLGVSAERIRNSNPDEIFGINKETTELLEESIRQEIRLLLMNELGGQFSVAVSLVNREDRFYTILEEIYRDVGEWLDIFEKERIIPRGSLGRIRYYVEMAFDELLGAYIECGSYPYLGQLEVFHLFQRWFDFIPDDEFFEVISKRIKTNQGKYTRLRSLNKKKDMIRNWQDAINRLAIIKKELGLRNNANGNRLSKPANLSKRYHIKSSI